MELDEIRDSSVISSIESDGNANVGLTQSDKICNIICVFGLCLVICSGILMIPVASIFIGFSSADLVLEEAEETIQARGLEALKRQISDLKIDPIEGTAGKFYNKK